ncbi:MAG TPA: transglycosylase SLT domain-containing protein [Paludibacter sp.]|nr:transglycosylase SLT domain-containing protein [Paludibacter sp.]
MRQKHLLALLLFSILLPTSCRQKKIGTVPPLANSDLEHIVSSDTLRVATMYGSTSYFLFRDETMGYDYEMAVDLANHLQVNLKILVAKTEKEMKTMLRENKVDLIAYNTAETKESKTQFKYVFPQNNSYMVLVQNKWNDIISNVTELSGKKVVVPENSIYLKRLNALNDEIGGTIHVVTVPDTVSTDELIGMVAEKKADLTVAYYNIASLHKTLHKNLDCRLRIAFEQRNGWLVRKNSVKLVKAIENWESLPETEQTASKAFLKYWNKSPYITMLKIRIPKGSISPYDHLFKKYAEAINWDWRLLAAVAFHESRFDASEISWAGAAGVMQLMPRTASNFGLNRRTVLDPELNIEAGVQYIKSLNMSFRKIENKEERIKFILAAYNSGPAHILDAMALASKYGKKPNVWFNEVEYYLLKKSKPEFYNDPVVRYGYFGGKETARYVHNTLDTYHKYLKKKQ